MLADAEAPRKKILSVKGGLKASKPMIITSPLNKKSQQQEILMFSQTGKLNAQLESDMMMLDDS